jgi:MinD-like ATPase involved in chromosome partitioning or flagellar assembly
MANVNIGIVQALQHKIDIKRVIVPHTASGVHVLLGPVGEKYVLPTADQLRLFSSMLGRLEYDFVLVDTAPGVPFPEPIKNYNEALIITLPDEVSTISAVKMIRWYNKKGVKTSVIVNRVANKRHELSIREVESLCENRVTGILPEDESVKVSIAEHIPLFLKNANEPFSKQIGAIGSVYASRSFVVRVPQSSGSRFATFFNSIKGFFRRKGSVNKLGT